MEIFIILGAVVVYWITLAVGQDLGENQMKRKIIQYMIKHIDDEPEKVLEGIRNLL